jgi:ABC-type nickel/cobalt efflux system permease component RcnA
MVNVVIVLNLLLALGCWWLVGNLWQLRRSFAHAANVLAGAEQKTYKVLHAAPPAIANGQRGTRHLRQQYQRLERQLQQMERVLTVLSLGQRWYRQQCRQSSR